MSPHSLNSKKFSNLYDFLTPCIKKKSKTNSLISNEGLIPLVAKVNSQQKECVRLNKNLSPIITFKKS